MSALRLLALPFAALLFAFAIHAGLAFADWVLR